MRATIGEGNDRRPVHAQHDPEPSEHLDAEWLDSYVGGQGDSEPGPFQTWREVVNERHASIVGTGQVVDVSGSRTQV